MASQKIDELQIQIGSDASGAIRQLGDLAAALNTASAAAAKLGGMSGALESFSHGIESITRHDLSGAIDNLTKLSRIDLSNLKDKKVNIDISISGADRMDRLRYAASQAERDVSRSVTSLGKTLGKDLGIDDTGMKSVKTILHDITHDLAMGGNAASGVERLQKAISDSATVSTADLTNMREAYNNFLKDVESLSINPGQISKDEMAAWKKMGLQRILQNGGQRIDTDIFGFGSDFLERNSDVIDAFSVPMDAPDQFEFLREKILEAKAALNGFVQTDATKERIREIAESYKEQIQGMVDPAISKRMVGSADKIPIDLQIDQSRFEKQIQDAINAATNKTYDTKPIKLNIDNQQLRQNVEAAFSLVDLPQLPKMASGFAAITESISTLNQTNLKDTGINSFVHALRKLGSTDMSKFDVSILDKMSKAITEISNTSGVDKTITKFVSALSRLAAVGDNTKKTADGLIPLAESLKTTIKTLSLLSSVDQTITQFVYGLAKLAAAGDNTKKTADNLQVLTSAVVNFVNELSKAPDISSNVASAIHGLGMLAESGANVKDAMSGAADNKEAKAWAGIVTKSLGTAVKTLGHDLKVLLTQIGALGAKGASILGGFLQKLHMLPSAASDVDRMALSFGNLLRAILPFYGIRGIFDWAKQSFEAGSSIVELQNVINTAFGSVVNGYRDISGYIYDWSKGTIDAFGVSEIAAQRYAGRLMSMFNSSGFDASEAMRDSAAQMTKDLVERAGDIASFYDIGVDEAMTKMQAAMAGMSRPMRALGVNMNVANLEAFALSQGIHQSWQQMDQATQMAVRYAYMLEATKYAEGDFGRTSMSAANQVRILQLNVQQLSATIGQGLVSAIAPVLAWLNALIKRLIQAAVAFRTFMWTLFGKPLAAVKGIVDETAGYLDDAASGIGDVGGGAADGLGSAGKAAKELKKQLTLLPFDEINQLAKDTDSAGSGGGGGGGGGGVGGLGDMSGLGLLPDFEDSLANSPVFNAINAWAAQIRSAFLNHQWSLLGRTIADGINAGFAYLYDILDWNKLKPIIVDGFIVPFQTTFNTMMAFIKWDQIGATLARGLNDIVYTLRAWITGFEWRNYGIDFGILLNNLVRDWDAGEFGRLIADKFKAAWDFFGGWVDTFNFKIFGTKLEEMILNGLDELDPADMGQTLGRFVTGLADTIHQLLGDGQVKSELATAFAEFINGFIQDLDEDKVKGAIKDVWKTVSGVFKKTFKDIDLLPLIDDLLTILDGLPWAKIGFAIVTHVAGALSHSLAGGVATKLITDLLVGALTGGGAAAAGGAAAGGATTAAGGATMAAETINLSGPLTVGAGAAAGAGTGVTGKQKLTGLITGGIAAGTLLAGAGIKKLMSMFGGSKSKEEQQGTGSGRYFGTPTVTSTPSPQGKAEKPSATSVASTKTTINTTLTGKEDPSFKNLLVQKASLMDTPQVNKVMNGELTPYFQDAYSKFTDTKAYKSVKDFGAKVSEKFQTWWPRNTDTKNYSSSKGMNAKIGSQFSTWWPRNTDKKNYSSTKGMNASIGGTFNTWWWRNTDRSNYSSSKGMNASIGSKLSTWWWRNTDQYSYPATKSMNARDAGRFVEFTDLWKGIKDKWVDVNVSIVKKTSDLGAWIKGKWEELVSFEWFAKGGLFTSATAIPVFGEAGAEAAIPLERKSTMKRIGNAIVNAGGMATSNSDEIADAVAERLAPIIMSAISGQESRPINVSATLYTENNEVLARAVNQGNKNLDKRYRPVSQYSY